VPVPDSALTDLAPRPYAEVRQLLRTGDLVLCSGSAIFSKAIRWATRSPWSHIGLIVRLDEIDRVMVLESVEKYGVRTTALSRMVSGDGHHRKPYPGPVLIARHAVFEARARGDPQRLSRMGDFAADRLGAPFSSGEIVKIMTRIAASGLGMRLPRILLPSDEFICSEYVAQCYRRMDIAIPWDGLGFIAPADFAKDPQVEAVARLKPEPVRRPPA
jgi:hypothetical protein